MTVVTYDDITGLVFTRVPGAILQYETSKYPVWLTRQVGMSNELSSARTCIWIPAGQKMTRMLAFTFQDKKRPNAQCKTPIAEITRKIR